MSKKSKKKVVYKGKKKNKILSIEKNKPIIDIQEIILVNEELNEIRRELGYSIEKPTSKLSNFSKNKGFDAKIKHKKKRSGD